MNVIRHDYVIVESILPSFVSITNGTNHDLRDFRLTQVEWASARGVEKSVERNECLS